MKVTVKVVGSIRPTAPITPLELAMAVEPYVGKTFEVEISPSATVQSLADAVDMLMGISPAQTFEEVLIEDGSATPMDKSATLSAAGVADGDVVNYRFVMVL